MHQTKVENLYLAVVADMYVRGLQVAVDDSPGVCEAQTIRRSS